MYIKHKSNLHDLFKPKSTNQKVASKQKPWTYNYLKTDFNRNNSWSTETLLIDDLFAIGNFKWAGARQNQQNHLCTEQRLGSACIRPVWPEFSLALNG